MNSARAISHDPVQQRPDAQRALTRLLDDLATVLLALRDDLYRAKPLPGVSGSIGEHVRHVLDHVSAFAGARPYGTLTYDTRERGTPIETDRGAALRAMLRLKPFLEGLSDQTLDSPVLVMSVIERGSAPEASRSTLRRELAFVLNHTVHHQALIATLLAITGASVPEAFGLAPSTPNPVRS
jgi:uncharacterized damage-inducible protein DinB